MQYLCVLSLPNYVEPLVVPSFLSLELLHQLIKMIFMQRIIYSCITFFDSLCLILHLQSTQVMNFKTIASYIDLRDTLERELDPCWIFWVELLVETSGVRGCWSGPLTRASYSCCWGGSSSLAPCTSSCVCSATSPSAYCGAGATGIGLESVISCCWGTTFCLNNVLNFFIFHKHNITVSHNLLFFVIGSNSL